MGRRHRGVHRISSDDNISLLRQADAAAYVDNIRSYVGTDGCRRSRGVDCLSDARLVGLSALVSAGIVFVDMLVPVSAAIHVAQDAAARQRGNAHRQHRGGRQHHIDAARQRLPVRLFGTDGLHDGFTHADHDELPAQPTKTRNAAQGPASSGKESGTALGDGHPDALCRYAAGRRPRPRRNPRHPPADCRLLCRQYLGRRDIYERSKGIEALTQP